MGEKIIKISAPGKIILSGEHSVVYGKPAVLTAVNRKLKVEVSKGKGVKIISREPPNLAQYAIGRIEELLGEKIEDVKIKINSQIPVNRGMGSSAALSVAITAALLGWKKRKWKKEIINKIAYEIEKKQHGKPSGADNSASCFGGLIKFQRGKIRKIKPEKVPSFILIDSGRAIESTAEMVALVKGRKKEKEVERAIKKMGEITSQIIREIKSGKNEKYLKELLIANEKLLEKIGIVGKKAQKIIREIESMGGAAKITGAGGIKKGSGIIIAFHKNISFLENNLQKKKWNYFKVKPDTEGVKEE